ncbi:MAG: heavy metal-associated domain-containing protein [Nitrospirales bacterium]
MTTKNSFPINGMTCGNCARHVEKALQALPGILHVQVNLEKHLAQVEYDSSLISYSSMTAALKEAGYTMEEPIE